MQALWIPQQTNLVGVKDIVSALGSRFRASNSMQTRCLPFSFGTWASSLLHGLAHMSSCWFLWTCYEHNATKISCFWYDSQKASKGQALITLKFKHIGISDQVPKTYILQSHTRLLFNDYLGWLCRQQHWIPQRSLFNRKAYMQVFSAHNYLLMSWEEWKKKIEHKIQVSISIVGNMWNWPGILQVLLFQ